ncbi:MAG: ubiquinol-cytochrome c reductase iron-sulfur subunit [Candidatus Hodgkinia cicadicola]
MKFKTLTLDIWYAYSGLSAFISVGSVMYPLLHRLFVSKTMPSNLTLDIRKITPAKVLVINWNGLPIFVRNRTYDQIKQARMAKLNSFKDKLARNDNLPPKALAFDINRCVDKDNQNLLVVMASCPHLGCVPSAISSGWFCSCHGSKFDISGRIINGPSPSNMRVPKCFVKMHRLVIEA